MKACLPTNQCTVPENTKLLQDTQENFGNTEQIDVPIELIERKEDSYFIEIPMTYVYEVDLQSIDKCEMVEL